VKSRDQLFQFYGWLLIRFILFEFHHLHPTIPHGFSDFANDVQRRRSRSFWSGLRV
jgi:hypothetical protein